MSKKAKVLIVAGLLLICAALGLAAFNLWSESNAGKASDDVLSQMEGMLPTKSDAVPDYVLDPNMAMPTFSIDGADYIGIVQIPSLGLQLPVAADWSYPQLRTSPCRYSGSAYLDDLVICGHNYSSHFGSLKYLDAGEEVIFTDADGNVFIYEVCLVETMQPTAVTEMTSGQWDLTLFTCTIGGQSRVTVRCNKTA